MRLCSSLGQRLYLICVAICCFLTEAVKAVNPFIKRMMEEDQEDYLEDYIRHTRKYGLIENEDEKNEEDVRIRVDYTLLIIYGRK